MNRIRHGTMARRANPAGRVQPHTSQPRRPRTPPGHPAAPWRSQHHVLAIAITLAVIAAAVPVSVVVYSAVRGPAKPATAPAYWPSSSLAARVNPGLVDVTATLGYQQAVSAGTGMVLTPWAG